jgi:thioredoxin 1
MPQVVEVADETFEKEVSQADIPVAADFYAQLCPNCKRVTPIFEQLSDEYSGRVKFVKVDVAKASETARRHAVLAVPSIFVFKSGQEVDRIAGYADKAKLARLIEAAL